jgi:hypothetical protein
MEKRILADMHTHLNEKKINPKDWWKEVIKKKLSIIAITEHVEYNPKDAYQKLKESKPKKIILIPGMEAKTTAGHLLIYGTSEKVYDIPKLQKVNIPIEEALIIIKENNLVAGFAHPYGYKTDSAINQLGEKEAKRLMKKYSIGSEYYNGMLGSANGFVFGTEWVKKLYNFFDFMEKNKASKRIKLVNKSKKIKKTLEQISTETLDRVRKGILFGQNATYITAGSDAHYPRVIGSAVIELKKSPKNEKAFLEAIRKKQINWAGPNIYSKDPVDKLKKKELLEGLKYVTKKRFKKKLSKKRMPKSMKKKARTLKQKIKNKRIHLRMRRR